MTQFLNSTHRELSIAHSFVSLVEEIVFFKRKRASLTFCCSTLYRVRHKYPYIWFSFFVTLCVSWKKVVQHAGMCCKTIARKLLIILSHNTLFLHNYSQSYDFLTELCFLVSDRFWFWRCLFQKNFKFKPKKVVKEKGTGMESVLIQQPSVCTL